VVKGVFVRLLSLSVSFSNQVSMLVSVLQFSKPEHNGDSVGLVLEVICHVVLPAVFFNRFQAIVSSGDWFR
jgi:hypothetical protein